MVIEKYKPQIEKLSGKTSSTVTGKKKNLCLQKLIVWRQYDEYAKPFIPTVSENTLDLINYNSNIV